MPDNANLYPLLVTEILMIVHLSSDKGISSSLDGLIEQEIPCPSTYSNFLHRPVKQFITHSAFHIKSLFHFYHKVICCHWLMKTTYNTATSLYSVDCLRSKESSIRHSKFLGDLEVHSSKCIIHIGMHRDDADMIFYSLYHSTLHVCKIANSFQSTKQ